jgi:hypothetical protein
VPKLQVDTTVDGKEFLAAHRLLIGTEMGPLRTPTVTMRPLGLTIRQLVPSDCYVHLERINVRGHMLYNIFYF